MRRPVSAAALLALAGACAAEPPAVEAPATTPTIEGAREALRSTARWLASGVDSWFGPRPFEDGGKVSDGLLDMGLLKRQHEKLDADLRINARLKLPNIDRLGYVFVGRDNARELVTDQPGALTRQDQLQPSTAQDKAFFLGLGRTLDEVFDVRLGVRGAFKPYAQARARLEWQLGAEDHAEARQTLFWTVDDRAGSTTALSFGHVFTPTLGLRWLGAATITQALPRFVWATSLGAYQSWGPQQVLSLEALANGQQGSGVATLDRGLQVRWEQPVHEDWLLGHVMAGRFWPQPDAQTSRRGIWALGAGLKLRF